MTLLNQVRKTITQYHLISRDETIVLGVSGGPDSLALAHLFRALRDEWHIHIHIAHLNHQLRGADADADADFVAWLAREWNLPATIEARDVAAYAREKKLSIEQAAREMRYAFLVKVAQKVGAHTIAVAHHADDQVETVLMHLLRGAGMAGLRGMEYKSQIPNPKLPITNYQIEIVRPLLNTTRAEIETYCRDNALNPRIDLSNLDTTLFRNRLRQEVLPYLETLNPNLRSVLLRTARSLADDYDFLREQASEAFSHVAEQNDGVIIFARDEWRALHPALQRATLRIAFTELRGDDRNLGWDHIENARVITLEKNAGTVVTLPRGVKLTIGYDKFFIADAASTLPFKPPQLHTDRLALPKQGVVDLPASDSFIGLSLLPRTDIRADELMIWKAYLDAEKIVGEMFLRRRKPGDTFQPTGMHGHTKSLHEFMIDEKIPHHARERLPILCDREKILWVCGYRVDERARVTEATREALQVMFWKNNLDRD